MNKFTLRLVVHTRDAAELRHKVWQLEIIPTAFEILCSMSAM